MTGAERIAEERRRQIESEHWTPRHDLQHDCGELVDAAICYAVNGGSEKVAVETWDARSPKRCDPWWPWADERDKRDKHGRQRSLVIAGALIAAEIDRLAATMEG